MREEMQHKFGKLSNFGTKHNAAVVERATMGNKPHQEQMVTSTSGREPVLGSCADVQICTNRITASRVVIEIDSNR